MICHSVWLWSVLSQLRLKHKLTLVPRINDFIPITIKVVDIFSHSLFRIHFEVVTNILIHFIVSQCHRHFILFYCISNIKHIFAYFILLLVRRIYQQLYPLHRYIKIVNQKKSHTRLTYFVTKNTVASIVKHTIDSINHRIVMKIICFKFFLQ